jgi:hypothetical protein
VGHPKHDQSGEEWNGERGHAKDGVSLFGASNMVTTWRGFKNLQSCLGLRQVEDSNCHCLDFSLGRSKRGE